MLKLLISNGVNLPAVDYTRYVIPSSIQMDDSINVPTLLSFTLANTDSSFVTPIQSAYVQWVSTASPLAVTGAWLFTGFITNSPQFKFLGLGQRAGYTGNLPVPTKYAQGGPLFQHYEIDVKCTSDEYLLNMKAVPFIAAYVNQTMGQILINIAEALAPGYFDVSGIQAGDIVPYFTYDPTSKWADIAKQFGDQAQFRYKALGKKLYFEPYGDASIGISYNETSQRQNQLVPGALETGILAVPLVNDCLIVGDIEPQQFHDDYFCGDGFTGNFPLKYTMFQGDTNLLLQDDWTEQAFNTSLWFNQDLGGQFQLAGALNDIGIGVEGPLGDAYILGQSGVELGGHVVLQHGEFQFNDISTGVVGGMYNSEANLTLAGVLAGFQISCSTTVTVTASGADGIIIQPILSGAMVGTPITTVHNHHYVLETDLAAKNPFRYEQIYRSLAGTPFGNYMTSSNGDITFKITDIDLGQAYNIATLDNPYVPAYIPVITKYTAFNVPLPSFSSYVILNSGGVDPNYSANLVARDLPPVAGNFGALNLTVNYTMISKPPQAHLYVASLTGAQPQNTLNITGGMLPPYDPNDPLADEDTFAIGPLVHYAMGFGMDYDLTATVAIVGDYDQLEFYSPLKIPGVGARIKFQGWQAGHALSRVQDPVSIAKQAAIVGDNGLRSAIINDLQPLPRTSYECDYAAEAMIVDREMVQYQGSYNVESYFWDNTQDYPRSGRFFNVTAPGRGISGEQFLVREVTTTALEMFQEILQFNVSYGQDLYLDKMLRRFIAQPEGTTGILQPSDTALAPNPQQLPAPGNAFTTYLSNLPDAQATEITGTTVTLDFGVAPVTGIEVRRTDTGWASNTQNLLTVATSQVVRLPRSIWDQTWFCRMVNGSQTSRFTRVIRVNYPMVPLPPSAVTTTTAGTSAITATGAQALTNPLVAVSLPNSFDRNIYGLRIDMLPPAITPCQPLTVVSSIVGDTRTVTLFGLTVGNVFTTETIPLNGTTPVTGLVDFCYLMYAEMSVGVPGGGGGGGGNPANITINLSDSVEDPWLDALSYFGPNFTLLISERIQQSDNFFFVGPLDIMTTSLPNAAVGEFYTTTLTATGGLPPYTWSVSSGSLPPGLSLSSSGVISGTPTTAGTFNFTIQVTDSSMGMAFLHVVMGL